MQITDNGNRVTVERQGYITDCVYDVLPKVAIWRCVRRLRKAERLRKRLEAVRQVTAQPEFVPEYVKTRRRALQAAEDQLLFNARLEVAIEAGLVRGPKK